MFRYERRARPAVKWAGGKANCLPRLLQNFPSRFERYLEPFVGGGAVFLSLSPGVPALLNDANADLMGAYRAIRDFPLSLMEALDLLRAGYSETFYYELRAREVADPVERAARFIFLNKTCYNGLYRTNARGNFNVPFGKRKRCPALYDRANLLEISYRLRGVQIFCTDFEAVIDSSELNDLVYCDPPYLPVSGTAHFSEYTAEGFSVQSHQRLRDACARAVARGAHVVLSNAAVADVHQIYDGWRIEELEVPRSISAKAERRGSVREVIVRP